ncbi:hypothetical protein K438DRAFT_1859470 [Mycena galopus ATCC 62051]|nr:hypothetical protein K438DRAFT_1859470 [Mycena galopus ATCC 62051]
MQLASYGARVLTRKAPQSARSLHVLRPQSGGSLGQKLLTQTRLALNRFVTHLTTPGTGTVSVSRSFHAVNPSIHQRLSFAARNTLSRPLAPQFLPRGPVVPRGMTQVGLGTARNFSSGRPIFQQLADNIPIAGRAFYEADWELNMHKERLHMRRPSKKAAKQASKELLKPTVTKVKAASAATVDSETELEHYFPAPLEADVTTYLLIPLAPTPTARAPLPEFPLALPHPSTSGTGASDGRLPLPALLALHDAHEAHSLRVSSLFHRLDTADVWTKGVLCSAYASSANAEGVCTVLKVEFRGWSKAAVRGVIGESGTGWCVLEETRATLDSLHEEDEDALSDASSLLSGRASPMAQAAEMDPAQSFILPTLDFSSDFLARSSPSPSSHGDSFFTHPNTSAESDLSLSSGGWSDHTHDFLTVDPPSENGWFEAQVGADPWLDVERDNTGGWQMGFSSQFSSRLTSPGPMESVFA